MKIKAYQQRFTVQFWNFTFVMNSNFMNKAEKLHDETDEPIAIAPIMPVDNHTISTSETSTNKYYMDHISDQSSNCKRIKIVKIRWKQNL